MNRIKEIRKLHKITQGELAEACGETHPQNIQRYEAGTRGLTVEKMQEIAEAFSKLGVPTKPSDLLVKEDQALSDQGQTALKISKLEGDLKKQHEEFLDYLLEKQAGSD